jgi:hypothetical protein
MSAVALHCNELERSLQNQFIAFIANEAMPWWIGATAP